MTTRTTNRLVELVMRFIRELVDAQRERERGTGAPTRRTAPRNRPIAERVRIEYRPELDGDGDPGEVVWTWVPYEENPNKGKDRPVVIVGRLGAGDDADLAGVPLTSKHKRGADQVPVGTGAWDSRRRPSYAKVDRLIAIDPDDVRREGAILARDRFDDVVDHLRRHHDLT